MARVVSAEPRALPWGLAQNANTPCDLERMPVPHTCVSARDCRGGLRLAMALSLADSRAAAGSGEVLLADSLQPWWKMGIV